MDSFKDINIFNSFNPDTIVPKAKTVLTFPLENIDAQIADIYSNLSKIEMQLEAAKKNPVNKKPARVRRLNSLLYKVKASLKMLQEVSKDVQVLSLS